MANRDMRVKHLSDLLDDAKKYRKTHYDDRWNENLRWIKGQQQLQTGSDFKSDTVTNFLFAQIMTMLPVLSNRVPEISLTPIDPQHKPHAELLTNKISLCLNNNDYISRQTEMVTNGLLFGRGYIKPVWNPKLMFGLGDIEINSPDARSMFKDKLYVRNSNWVQESRQVDKLTLLQMHPKKKALIDRAFRKTESQRQEDSYQTGGTGEVGLHAAEEGDTPTTSEAYVWDVATNRTRDHGTVEVVEAWFPDESVVDDVIKINASKPDGERYVKNKKVKRKEFPRGRLITYIHGFDQDVLDDRPNPFIKYPYIDFENYFIPGSMYGFDELTSLKGLQEQYNIRANQIADGLNWATFPITFYDHRSGLEPEEIENKPGEYVPVEDVDGIKKFDPSGINAAAFQSLPYLEHVIESISGVREVTQGQTPGDVRSGYAIEQLQEAANNRMRLKTRNLEYATKNLAKYLTYLMGEFYVHGVHYTELVDLSGVVPEMFRYEIKGGVNLPNSRVMEEQRYMWLYSNMIVDEMFIVENFDIPDKNAVIERMQPMWAAKKQALTGGGMGDPGMMPQQPPLSLVGG